MISSLFVIASVAGGPAAPAPYRIIDVAEDFLSYFDAAKDADPAVRLEAWTSTLEAKHKAFFDQVIYRNKDGEDRERFKRWCFETFWREVAPKAEALRRLRPTIPGEIGRALASFRKTFPDFEPSTDFYVAISFSFRGKVVRLNEKDVFAIGIEQVQPGTAQIPITIAHELFHLYHFKTFEAKGGLYRTLWAEGLATYASAILVPGQRLSAILGFSGEKMNRCEELLPEMATELRREMGSNDERIRRIYFGAEPNETRIPPEAGYYVGFFVAESLAKERPLAELARLEPRAVYPLVERELARLAAAAPRAPTPSR